MVLYQYKRGEAKPSIDVAKKIADLLDLSLDYFTGKIDVEVDKKMMDKALTMQNPPDEERDRILLTIDALVREAKARFAYAS